MIFAIRRFFLLVVLVFLCACAPVTMNQFLAEGKKPLSETRLHELIDNHRLHLEAIDFNAEVQYLTNGHLDATSLQGEKDTGKWHITSDNQLCMKFDSWYFGDERCYMLFNEKGKYVFFTTNGARYYTGVTLPENNHGDPNQSGSETSGHRDVYSANKGNEPTVLLSETEKKDALIGLARNCPDCNFTGADLRGAQLVAANLAGANLSQVDLSDANLRRANLAGANLSGAKLIRTNLAAADLTNCDLSNADLSGSNLILATVTGAKLDGTLLTGAHLESIQGLKK